MITRSNTRISNFSVLPHSLIIFTILLLIFPALAYAQDALWTKIEGPWEQELDGFFESIAINPNNGKVVYIGNTNGGGIYKTVDGGDTWIEINSGLPKLRFTSNYFPIRALVIDPSSPNTLYAGTSTSDPYSTPGLMGRGIYKSVNAGVSWSQANSSGEYMLSRTSGTLLPIFTIRVDPKKSDTLYTGLRFGGIWKSTDGGNSWTETNNGLYKDSTRGFDIDVLAVDPVNIDVVYAAGNVTDIFQYGPIPQGIYKSIDAGSSWLKLNTGTIIKPIPYTALVSSLTVNPNNPSILYFATTSKGIYKSMDGGITWSETNGVGNNKLPKNPVPRLLGYFPIKSLVIDPLLPDTIYAGLISGGVYKSVDGGTNWLPFNEGLNNVTVNTLVFASNSSSHMLYAATTKGIFEVNLSGDVRGYVKDSTTNQPISEALIQLYHENDNYTGRYAYSESPNGHFRVRNVPVANYYLTITKSRYSSIRDPKAGTFYIPTAQEEQGVPEEYWGLNRGDVYLTPTKPLPGKIAFIRDHNIWIMNPDGIGQKQLTADEKWIGNLSWSPDGKKIAFVNQRGADQGLKVVGVATGKYVTLVKSKHIGKYFSWLSNTQLIFCKGNPKQYRKGNTTFLQDNPDLYSITADGLEEKRLTWNQGSYYPISSPDGSKIIFIYNLRHGRHTIGDNFLGIINPDGTKQKILTEWWTNYATPIWSPDSSNIYYCLGWEGSGEIGILDLESAEKKSIGCGLDMDLSPSGNVLAIIEPIWPELIGSDARLITFNLQTHTVKVLVEKDVYPYGLSWSPDGKYIAFSRGHTKWKGIWLVGVDGKNLCKIADSGWQPVWSLPKITTKDAVPTFDPETRIQASGDDLQVKARTACPSTFVVDWNNDGKKDLLLGTYSPAYIYLYLNKGTDASPLFTEGTRIQANDKDLELTIGANPFVIDWNNDGKKDLITAGEVDEGPRSKPIYLYLNNGTDADPIFTNGIPIRSSQGVIEGSYPFVVDWNNDERKDLLVGHGGWMDHAYVDLYLNNGTDASPIFTTSTRIKAQGFDISDSYGSAPFVIDWNADGKKDLLVRESHGFYYYLNVGTDDSPEFGTKMPIQAGGNNLSVYSGDGTSLFSVVDWNNDGWKDLIIGDYYGFIYLYLSPGITFAPTEITKKRQEHYQLGRYYLKEGKSDEAIKEFKKVVEIVPDDADAHRMLGHSYLGQHMFDEAVAELRKVLEIQPDDFTVHDTLARVYMNKKMYKEAITQFEKYLEIVPDDPRYPYRVSEAHYVLGHLYLQEKMYDKAIVQFEKRIESNPNDYTSYYDIGLSYYHKNLYDEAIAAIKKCLSLEPSKVVQKEATELLQKIEAEKRQIETEQEEWEEW